MKRDLKKLMPVLITVLLLSLGGYSVQDQKQFTLRVSIENLATAANIILTVRDGNQWTEYKSESTTGKFIITGSLNEPSFGYLVMKYNPEIDKTPRRGNITELFIGLGENRIQTRDSLRNAQISGGVNQKDLESLNLAIQSTNPQLANSRIEAISSFVKTHPDSFVSLYALQNLSANGAFIIDPNIAGPLFEQLSNFIRNTNTGKILDREIEIARKTAIGSIAPEFAQEDTLRQLVHLQTFKGNYVLIDFWASWCKPCREENPAFVSVYKKFKEKNFKILGVSLDKSRKAWASAIRKDNLVWANVSDLKFWRNEVALLYGVKTVPQNFLLDPQGKIIARNVSSETLSEKLEEIFSKK